MSILNIIPTNDKMAAENTTWFSLSAKRLTFFQNTFLIFGFYCGFVVQGGTCSLVTTDERPYCRPLKIIKLFQSKRQGSTMSLYPGGLNGYEMSNDKVIFYCYLGIARGLLHARRSNK